MEGRDHAADAEYRDKYYAVPEHATPLDDELRKVLPADDLARLAATENKGIALIGLQSETIKDLYAQQQLAELHRTEMQKTLKDLLDQQSRAERIRTFRTRASTPPSTPSWSGSLPRCCRCAWCASSIG